MGILSVVLFIFGVIGLVVGITVHEFAHAFVADLLGDPTPRHQGRVTLNPLKHLDPVGTILIFMVQLGWGRPVEINPSYFRNRRRDEVLTALAGPAANILLALGCATLLKYVVPFVPVWTMQGYSLVDSFVEVIGGMSLVLFVFNILPFPPLDGATIWGWFVPKRSYHLYERYLENGAVYFLVFLLVDRFVLVRFFHRSILQQILGPIVTGLSAILFWGT